jgi:hypothetical protein
VELGKAVGTVVSTVVTGLLGILAYKLRKRFRRHHETRDHQVSQFFSKCIVIEQRQANFLSKGLNGNLTGSEI